MCQTLFVLAGLFGQVCRDLTVSPRPRVASPAGASPKVAEKAVEGLSGRAAVYEGER